MKSYIVIVLFIATTGILSGQSFSDFIDYVETFDAEDRQAHVDSFLAFYDQTPITETDVAYFIHTGNENSMAVAGDFNGWFPVIGGMVNLDGTDLWYRPAPFNNATRVEYKLVANGNDWFKDSGNPNTSPGSFGNSVLWMPDYVPPHEVDFLPGIPHGTLEEAQLTSTNLNNERTVQVYLPPGYADDDRYYPMVLVHDGHEYVQAAAMENILDYLIHEEMIDPVIVFFVPPVNRSAEYANTLQDVFTAAVVEEFIPWLEANYRVLDGPENRATIGSSNGGNISLWLGMSHPEVFGKVGAFSPYIEPDIRDRFNIGPKLDLRIYINHGTYDHIDLIHESVDAILPILESDEYDYIFSEYPEGHNYGFWRAYLDEALTFLFPFGSSTTDVKEINDQAAFSIYPNPATNFLEIEFKEAPASSTIIQFWSISGVLVKNEEVSVDRKIIRVDISDLSPGMYRLRTDGMPADAGEWITVQR